jgi:hypothetical protein
MATTTPNYGWDVPTSSDYVKLGAVAIETLGDDIDTTLYTALGGNYPGLRLVKKQTIGSAVSSVTVTGAFSATYENYRIVVSGGVASTTNYANMTLGSVTSGYSQKSVFGNYNDNSIAGAGVSAGSSWQAVVRAATNAISGIIELQTPFLSKVTSMDYVAKELRSGGLWEQGGGFINDATSFSAFTLTVNSGTWTGGTIYVYGYGAS